MKVHEAKGLIYENVLLIDVRRDFVHYPGAVHTIGITGGLGLGPCTEDKMEEMGLLEMMDIVERMEMERVEREDAWKPDTMIPEQSSLTSPVRRSRLYTHASPTITTSIMGTPAQTH